MHADLPERGSPHRSAGAVTVVGAGVAGLSAAVELTARGIAVEIIDRASGPGPDACSWHAGGMLAPWCEGAAAEEPVVRLGQEAIAWWDKHVPGVVKRGSLVVALARDAASLSRVARRTSEHETLNADAIARIEPDLAGRFTRALYFAREAHLDPRRALADLAAHLARAGVSIRYGTGLENPGPGGVIVDARGFAARDRLADLRGVRGEMLVVRSRDVSLTRPVRLIHPRFPVYIVPRGGGVYMIGATQIESSERGPISVRGAVDLLNAAYALHPAFGDAEIVETGADVRPAFADNLPRLRWRGRTLYINGLFRHGFLLAPACARMAAEAIANPHHIPEIMDEPDRERAPA